MELTNLELGSTQWEVSEPAAVLGFALLLEPRILCCKVHPHKKWPVYSSIYFAILHQKLDCVTACIHGAE